MRKAHVFRIFQVDGSGLVVDSDTWLDVMRIDRLDFLEGMGAPEGNSNLVRTYGLDWGDDTVASWLPTRTHRFLAVIQPDPGGGAVDPATQPHVNIPMLERTTFDLRGPTGPTGLGGATHTAVLWAQRNAPDDLAKTLRKVTAIRVTNNDLNNAVKMPVATAGAKPPSTVKGYGIDWAVYAQALQRGKIDDSQYVDVEVVNSFLMRFPPPFYSGQTITYGLVQAQKFGGPIGVLDLFKPPPRTGTGADAPYRIDPFQIIVNVSWGGPLAVEFGDLASDAPGDGAGGSSGGGG